MPTSSHKGATAFLAIVLGLTMISDASAARRVMRVEGAGFGGWSDFFDECPDSELPTGAFSVRILPSAATVGGQLELVAWEGFVFSGHAEADVAYTECQVHPGPIDVQVALPSDESFLGLRQLVENAGGSVTATSHTFSDAIDLSERQVDALNFQWEFYYFSDVDSDGVEDRKRIILAALNGPAFGSDPGLSPNVALSAAGTWIRGPTDEIIFEAEAGAPDDGFNGQYFCFEHDELTARTRYLGEWDSDANLPTADQSIPAKVCGAPQDARAAHSLLFDADSGERALGSGNQPDITGELTVEAWVRANATAGPQGFNFIVSKNLNGTGYALLAAGAGFDKRFRFEANLVTGIGVESVTRPQPAVWTHVAGVWGDGKARIYVDGLLENEVDVADPPVTNSAPLWLGSSPFGTEFNWRGEIDEVRIWRRALHASEIRRSMWSSIAGDEVGSAADLAASWPLDEGSGGIAFDRSGNTNHLNLTATAWSINIPRAAYFANIATRANVQTGDNIVIGGFVIGASEAEANKCILVRGRGPSVRVPLGESRLQNPTLELRQGSVLLESNDDFEDASDLAMINSTGFAPDNARESAIYACLPPGAYTALLRSATGSSGLGLVEVFDVDRSTPFLANISTRAHIGTGNRVAIGGFVVQGNQSKQVLIRGRGPTVGVPPGARRLSNPRLRLVDGTGTVLATNDDWGEAANANDISATGRQPGDAQEAAILITLAPGAYTAILEGAGGVTGLGLVEVFDQSEGSRKNL